MTTNVSSSRIEKNNGYEKIKHELARKEVREIISIHIAYEPVYDGNIPVPCFLTDKIHRAHRSCIEKMKNRKENKGHPSVRQSHYCENCFAKSNESMKKRIQVCAEKEGFTCCFNNGEIISFQDNFRYLGDVLFTVYFDFEKATGDSVFFETKMLVLR